MVRKHHHGQLIGSKLEAGEEAAGILVDLGVEEAMRIGVAGHEALQAQGVAVVLGSDQLDPTLAVRDQAGATQDEGPHDDLADVRLAGDQSSEVGAFDAGYAGGLGGAAGDQNLSVIEQVHLAGELTGALGSDDVLVAFGVVFKHLHRPVQHQEEVGSAFATLEQHIAGLETNFRSVLGHAGDLLIVEHRESLRLAGVGVARLGGLQGCSVSLRHCALLISTAGLEAGSNRWPSRSIVQLNVTL